MTTLATQYTGSLAMRLKGAEELIARSARFQAKVGAGNSEEAKNKIYGGEVTIFDVLAALEGEGGTLEVARPCAIIGVQGHLTSKSDRGARSTWARMAACGFCFSIIRPIPIRTS
jgi:hypothetical protein